MSKEAYVHEGVSLICTNGFRPAKLLVKDRGVRIAGGQLMATEEDKPTNFACKWAGVLAALIAAILIAAPFIVAVLAAFLIGMLAALSLGQLLCWVALQGGKWNMVHPRVKLKGQCALTENSRLTCALMGGDITIFYDEATASRALHNNWLRNSVEILGAAFMGRALGSSLITNGFLKGVQRVTFEVNQGEYSIRPHIYCNRFLHGYYGWGRGGFEAIFQCRRPFFRSYYGRRREQNLAKRKKYRGKG